MADLSHIPAKKEKYHKGINIADIIELVEHKGLTHGEAAKILGCDRSNVSAHLRNYGYKPGDLKKYQHLRADILSFHQMRLLNYLTDEKLKKSSAMQIASMYGILYDKERLETGKSTTNVAYADIVKAKEIEENRIKAFEDKYGLLETDDPLNKGTTN